MEQRTLFQVKDKVDYSDAFVHWIVKDLSLKSLN